MTVIEGWSVVGPDRHRPDPNGDVFVGRDDELAAIGTCFERARAGEASVVWIDGPAGAGKSTLVRRAVAVHGDGCPVHWGEADELGSETSFSLLGQYGRVEGTDPFAAGMQLLDRLSDAGDQPTVLVAEDLHWADPASSGGLLTLARRIRHDPVVLIVTSRPLARLDGWDRMAHDTARCLRLDLHGLSDRDVAALAERHGVALDPAHAARLRRHTDGHPLHVRALLAELTPEQLRAGAGELPAPRSLAAVTVATLAALPPASRDLAAALAVLGTRTGLPTVGRVAGVARPADALGPLLDVGLVRWHPSQDGTPVEFVHPLLRTAVYDDLAPDRRRDLHLASAGVTRWGTSWAHRVAAADGPDDALADELAGGAEYELARDDRSLAATYLQWASTSTSSRELAEERLLTAVRLLMRDGQLRRAEALSPRVDQCAESALRDLVIGTVAFGRADAAEAERWLRSAAAIPGPARVHADALGQLALLHVLLGRADDAVVAAEQALVAHRQDPVGPDQDFWRALAFGTGMRDGAPAGIARLAPRLPQEPAGVVPVDAELLAVRGMLATYAARPVEAVPDLRQAIALARQGGSFWQLPRAHLALTAALFDLGDWDEAELHGRTALELTDDDNRTWLRSQAEGTLVIVLAARGERALAVSYATAVAEAADRLGSAELDGLARIARASIARADGDAPGVVDALGPPAARRRAALAPVAWWPMLLQARAEVGDLHGLAADIDHLRDLGASTGLDLAAHVAASQARLAAAGGDPDAATDAFELALASFGPGHAVLERALTHRDYGRLLWARGARRPATAQLRAAHELLAPRRAEPYVRTIDADLITAEQPAPRRSGRSPLALTSREQDVVALANQGFTNREIGAQLYISAKAVEYHLGNVFRKLGVTSRRELRNALS